MTTEGGPSAPVLQGRRRAHAARRARLVIGGLSVTTTLVLIGAMVERSGADERRTTVDTLAANGSQVIVRVHSPGGTQLEQNPVLHQAPTVSPSTALPLTRSRAS